MSAGMGADCRRLSDAELFSAAVDVLDANRTPHGTRASPHLYPHQWSWDAAFIAAGLAVIDTSRARAELDLLHAGQWANGMIPHIVFAPDAGGYFPGPERWACASVSPHAPHGVATSGIIQPPVHALALAAIMEADAGQQLHTDAWQGAALQKVAAWHRYLVRERTDSTTGLITLFHGWESGMDNSPRWDAPYGKVAPGKDLPPYVRRDTHHVGSDSERPQDEEYNRYLWLLEEGKRVGYEASAWKVAGSFQVGDVFATAVFARACDVAATCADSLQMRDVADEMRNFADGARHAVRVHCDAGSGLAHDVDLASGMPLRTDTIAGFAPLLCFTSSDAEFAAAQRTLFSADWCTAEGLAFPLPPSTAPQSPAFEEERYWRGPVWPIMNWLLGWALGEGGDAEGAAHLRAHGLDQLRDGTFAEYYQPYDGSPLGSMKQSWTAAAALMWLAQGASIPGR